jgi:hypothetical protein
MSKETQNTFSTLYSNVLVNKIHMLYGVRDTKKRSCMRAKKRASMNLDAAMVSCYRIGWLLLGYYQVTKDGNFYRTILIKMRPIEEESHWHFN